MTNNHRGLASFARAVEALAPYLKDLVFVGGWAHYLYTLRPEASPLSFEPLGTEDADVAAPARLPRGRKTIAECLTTASFREHLSSDHTPPISEYVLGDEENGFYLEFLAPLVGGEIKRGGRRDVTTLNPETTPMVSGPCSNTCKSRPITSHAGRTQATTQLSRTLSTELTRHLKGA